MRAIVEHNLPRTSAKITFREGYPAMADSPANRALLAELRAFLDFATPRLKSRLDQSEV